MHIIKIGYNERNKGVSEDKWGDTVLCMAARKGDAAFADYLLVMGIPIQEALGCSQEAGRESWTQALYYVRYHHYVI